jgi:hypothetical protein
MPFLTRLSFPLTQPRGAVLPRLEMSQTIASVRTPKPAVRRLDFSGDLCLQVLHSRRLSGTGRRTFGNPGQKVFLAIYIRYRRSVSFFPTLSGRQFHRVTVVFRRSAIDPVTLNIHQSRLRFSTL